MQNTQTYTNNNIYTHKIHKKYAKINKNTQKYTKNKQKYT